MSQIKEKLVPILIVTFLVGGLYVMITKPNSGDGGASGPAYMVDVSVPDLTPLAKEGEEIFNNNCAACHGDNAGGSENGPSLIYTTYNPGHHADEAFFRAAKNGVRAHHWGFGDMPPVIGITDQEILKIVRYIRDLQFANGIITKPHNM